MSLFTVPKFRLTIIFWVNVFLFNHVIAQNWQSASNLNTARHTHSVVNLPDGKAIIIAGSVSGHNNGTSSC